MTATLDELVDYAMNATRIALPEHVGIALPWPGLPTFVRAEDEFPTDLFTRWCEAGALVTRAGWSPDQVQPIEECWSVVAVERNEPARNVVGPYLGKWYDIEPEDFVWFVASTAAGIRGSIDEGEPLVLKRAGTGSPHELFESVRTGNPPPVDEQGRV